MHPEERQRTRVASQRARAVAEGEVEAARRAVDAAKQLVAASVLLLAAAELDRSGAAGGVAHAIFDIGEHTPRHGVTLCELLADEEVVVLPQMPWQDVPTAARCALCDEATHSLPSG